MNEHTLQVFKRLREHPSERGAGYAREMRRQQDAFGGNGQERIFGAPVVRKAVERRAAYPPFREDTGEINLFLSVSLSLLLYLLYTCVVKIL